MIRTALLLLLLATPASAQPRALTLQEAVALAARQNPALQAAGADVGIAYTLGDGVGSVDIRILDPLGNEVRRQSGPTSPAGNVARIPVRDLASGVYLVRLEVKRGGSTEVAFRKFAVVR